MAESDGEVSGDDPAALQFTLPGKGTYLVVAVAPGGEDIDMAVLGEVGGRKALLAADTEDDSFPVGQVRVSRKARISVRVAGSKRKAAAAVKRWQKKAGRDIRRFERLY